MLKAEHAILYPESSILSLRKANVPLRYPDSSGPSPAFKI